MGTVVAQKEGFGDYFSRMSQNLMLLRKKYGAFDKIPPGLMTHYVKEERLDEWQKPYVLWKPVMPSDASHAERILAETLGNTEIMAGGVPHMPLADGPIDSAEKPQTVEDFKRLIGVPPDRRFPEGTFDSEEMRAAAVRFLVLKILRKKPEAVTGEDFSENGFGALYNKCGGASRAIAEAGFGLKAWEVWDAAPPGFFDDAKERIEAVKWLVAKMRQEKKKEPADIIRSDFEENRLTSLMHRYPGRHPYYALKEAGYILQPWQTASGVPQGYFKEKANRIAAMNWLEKKVGKEENPHELTRKDFEKNKLGGLLHNEYGNIISDALLEAGFIDEETATARKRPRKTPERRGPGVMQRFWEEMGWPEDGAPYGAWQSAEMRATAVRRLVAELKKKPEDIIEEDFIDNGIGTLYEGHYKYSIYDALCEAGFKVKAWKLRKTPKGWFDKEENRAEALRDAVENSGKKPCDIILEDFWKAGLHWLLNKHYDNKVLLALRAAGYELNEWEILTTPRGFFLERANRAKATLWLVETRLMKEPKDMMGKDFEDNGLRGLISNHHQDSHYAALREVHEHYAEQARTEMDPKIAKEYKRIAEKFDIMPWQMKITPHGYFDERERRIEAMEWLVVKTGKKARELKRRDFDAYGLRGMIGKAYHESPYEALFDAGLVTREDREYMTSRRRKAA